MSARSPYERINELINLIELNPTPRQITRFISRNICLTDEICGAGWLRLKEDGKIVPLALSGLKNSLESIEIVRLEDDNVMAEALRLQKPKFFRISEVLKKYSDSTHHSALSSYKSGMVLPLNSKIVIGMVLVVDYEELIRYKDYFELVQVIITLWVRKRDFDKSEFSRIPTKEASELTERQSEILALVKVGKTNASIAANLGYSESLIKQETIHIYRKLGVTGRNELLT